MLHGEVSPVEMAWLDRTLDRVNKHRASAKDHHRHS